MKQQVSKITQSIFSDTLQNQIKIHPLIVVADGNDIYYLKVTSYKPNQILKDYEVLIQPNQILERLSVVDTHKFYVINKKEFDNKFLVKLKTDDLNQKEVLKIYAKSSSFLNQDPPVVSLTKIKVISNKQIDPYTIYSHRSVLDQDLKTHLNIVKFKINSEPNLTQEQKDAKIQSIYQIYNDILNRSKNDVNLGVINELKLFVDDELSQLLDTYPKKVINQVSKELKEESQKEKDDDDKDEY